MNRLDVEDYRTAFAAYLRKGAPIRLTLKQARLTDRYVWRSHRDERVRPMHSMNDGRVFSWTDAPATGHPGEDHNCRCKAVPYVAGETEFGFHDFTASLASSYDRWTNRDFVRRYYLGGGRPVDLLEIGHLRQVAEQYAYGDGAEGAFRRLSNQISDDARKKGPGQIVYRFSDSYNFRDIAFSHGRGSVFGLFVGMVEVRGDMLLIHGETSFEFSDDFADPLDVGIEPGGTPYHISGYWTARFSAEVFKDGTRSIFRQDNNQ